MNIMNFTGVVLKNLFSNPVTINYPAEPMEYPKRSRGHIEIDIDDCILCGLCSRSCPSGALTVDRAAGNGVSTALTACSAVTVWRSVRNPA